MVFSDFEEFVMKWINIKNIETEIHFIPQYKFICTPGSLKPKTNFIGYYENIEKDFDYVKNTLGIGSNLIFNN